MADSRISFKEFCELCEKIQSFSKFADKENVLHQLIKKYKTIEQTIKQENSNAETSFYPVMRLLVPEYERERSPYGLKETSFSKLYVRTLCLKGSDANNLVKYNRTSSISKTSSDFADVAYWELRKWCAVSSDLTIADVNAHLDRMANYHAEHLPREVEKELRNMIKISTATEQKWIIRIILKNMRLGLGSDRILKVFHPDAPDLFDVSSSLSKICTVLKDPSVRLHELEVEIFTPFRPMLSLHCDSAVLNQTLLKGNKIFYVENKYDGERFQMHMKAGVYKYFSKNGYDYSTVYGETYDSRGLITPYLERIFCKVKSIILDGEMMGWNTKSNKFGSKGMSYDVKKLTTDSVHRPCYCVFDVLLYNGTTMTNKPLAERLKLLDTLFEPIEGVILKSPRLEVRTKQEMMDELNKSMDRQEEGICFKDPESIYKPNNRKAGWWKMKMEYFDGLMTELDVLIIGGYYGEGKRKGLISSFLLGVAEQPENTGASPSKFHSFAKVANGFTVEELDTLLHKLNPYWEPFEKNKNPEEILWKREKPDCWISPRKSCILQIKASELARTTDFQTDYTLRFPRVDKIRYDKPWYNCLTLTELKELTKTNQAVEKLNNRHLTAGDIDVSPSKRGKKTKDPSGLLYHLLDIQQKTNFLANKEFCVFTGTEEVSKESVEVKIRESGGKVVQYTGPNTMCTLIGNLTPKAKSLISDATCDIVKLEWLIRLLQNQTGKFLELTPDDMIVTSEKTKMMFSNRYDKYGDSYFVPATKESLQTAMKNITTQGDYLNLMPSEFINFDKELSFNNPFGIFRPCYAYFSKNSTKKSNVSFYLAQCDFAFYGGTKCSHIQDYTTHIIVDSRDNSVVEKIKQEIQDTKDIKIVNEHWIEQCLKVKQLISEEGFIVNL